MLWVGSAAVLGLTLVVGGSVVQARWRRSAARGSMQLMPVSAEHEMTDTQGSRGSSSARALYPSTQQYQMLETAENDQAPFLSLEAQEDSEELRLEDAPNSLE